MDFPINDTVFIEKLLPQKRPFVMVDSVLAFSGNGLTSSLKISGENVLAFGGEFSEAGILEHQAQSIALHAGFKNFQQKSEPQKGYIAMIKSAEIYFLPRIGEEIISKVEILSEAAGMSTVKITTECGRKPLAETEMKTVIIDNF